MGSSPLSTGYLSPDQPAPQDMSQDVPDQIPQAPDAPAPVAPDAAQPAAPAAAPQHGGLVHSMLQGVKGALAGLANGGILSGVEGAVDPNAVLAERQRRQDFAKAKLAQAQSTVKFQDAQSAELVAQAHYHAVQTQQLPQELKLKAAELDQETAKMFMNAGATPVVVSSADAAGAQAGLEQTTKNQGAVPPMLILHLGDKLVGFDLNQMSQNAGSLDQINKVNSITGSPVINAQMFAKLSAAAKVKTLNDAGHFFNPTPAGADKIDGQIEQYKNFLARQKMLPDSPDKEENISKLQGVVDYLQKTKQATIATKGTVAETTAKGRAAGKPAGAGKVENMVVGSMPDGQQVAGTADELRAGGAANLTKLPPAEAQKVVISRQLISPQGLFRQAAEAINDLDKQGKLGVAASRWNDFVAGKVGDQPEFAKLRTTMGLLSTALMQAHVGARGSEGMLQHFKELADYRISNAATLRAALSSEFKYVTEKAMVAKKKGN